MTDIERAQILARPIVFTTKAVEMILAGKKTCTIRRKEYFHKGEFLYVQETWCEINSIVYYKAGNKLASPERWRSSIHMPKEIARIFLQVTDTDGKYLHDVTDEEIFAYGAKDRNDFAHIWDLSAKNKKDKWETNPVVSICFFRLLRE